jgi:TM2 domain-containing membrane protein YozV/DNA-directed RNA polymerase subunit M/transcription elongation factor TFIIS
VIRFSCPGCDRVVEVSDEDAGLSMGCPTCGQRLTVPAGTRPGAAPTSQSARPRLSAQAAPDKGMAAIDDCPECGKALQVAGHEVGRRVACPRCGHQFVARATPKSATPPPAPEPSPAREQPRAEPEKRDDRRRPRTLFCRECGAEISKRDRYCPECDARQPVTRDPTLADAANKKLAAGLCGILLGYLGIHKFIIGATTAGVIMLLVSVLTCGLGSIVMTVIGIVEGIIYLTRSDEDFYETYLVGKKEWF